MFTQLVLHISEHFHFVNFNTTMYTIHAHQHIACDKIRLKMYWTQHRNLMKTLILMILLN